ncbi:hypothetical protein BSL78_03286 [Apostichopus japonicus]|uniref:Uncharacterized protein n=1 Tax=Stichopus japonicus TaxID=307972 RepID=A0A2G8LHX0_STIJA|nr:hypothetical protein BSL78_03286 [Apostichopus japonicus]
MEKIKKGRPARSETKHPSPPLHTSVHKRQPRVQGHTRPSKKQTCSGESLLQCVVHTPVPKGASLPQVEAQFSVHPPSQESSLGHLVCPHLPLAFLEGDDRLAQPLVRHPLPLPLVQKNGLNLEEQKCRVTSVLTPQTVVNLVPVVVSSTPIWSSSCSFVKLPALFPNATVVPLIPASTSVCSSIIISSDPKLLKFSKGGIFASSASSPTGTQDYLTIYYNGWRCSKPMSPINPTGEERARQPIEHLGCAAKEEVKCLTEPERKSYQSVVVSLKMCFGAHETVQTLSSNFHNRKQQENV